MTDTARDNFGRHPFRAWLIIRRWLVFLLLFYTQSVDAQKQFTLLISFSDHPEEKPIAILTDSTKLISIQQTTKNQLQASGFLYSVLDTTFFRNDTCFYTWFKGEKYILKHLSLTEEQQSIMEASGIKKLPDGKLLDSTLVYSFLKTLVFHQAKNGYPFATAQLNNLHFDDGNVSAGLQIKKGKYITMDSLYMEGRLDMKPDFFSRILEIRKGSPYNHEKITKANAKLKNLPYVTVREEPFVRFVNDKASLVLTLDPKPASRFDFLIGVLPQITSEGRKWLITGDVLAEMYNLLHAGEYMYFQIKRLQADNLELLIKNTVPYLFKSPIGSYLDFRIFKNGTKNLDLYFDGGMQYTYSGFNQIKIFGSYRSSTLLEINTDQIIQAKKLPANLDVTYTGAGVGLNIRNMDYQFNPTSGYTIDITTIAGRKSILPNRQIIDLEGFNNSYDTLKLSTLQAELSTSVAGYFKIKNWAAIKTGITTALKYNGQQLRTNELIRVGGSRLLRGFDEESLMTDFYAFGTAEFRLIFDQNSYMSLPFIDVGYISLIDEQNVKSLKPIIGLGLGLNFGTTAGIFNLSFAAGRVAPDPIDFSRMKIHFGYVNLF